MKKKIFKAILLWLTFLSVTLFAMTIESLSITQTIVWGVLNISIISACYHYLSYRDVYVLSGTRWYEQALK